MTEVVSHTVVALVVLVGGFTMMVISVATGRMIPDPDMTLLTVLMSGVTGWYFGTRSALSGVHAGQAGPVPAAPADTTGAVPGAGAGAGGA